MGVFKSNTATGKLYTQEHIRFCEAILPPFMALIVSLSYNTHRKRERHGKVLLLGSLIRIDQLQSQGAFPDSFFIWTLSDLLTFRASLTKPQWLHLNCMQCCAPSPHLLLPGSKREKQLPPQPLSHSFRLHCCHTILHASAWGALTLPAFLNYYLFSRSLIGFCNTRFLEKALPRSIPSHIPCFFHIGASINQSLSNFLLKPFLWEYIQNVIITIWIFLTFFSFII